MDVQFSNIPVSLDAMLPGNESQLRHEVFRACGIKSSQAEDMRILKKSVDARRKSNVHFVLTVVIEMPGMDEASVSKLRPSKGVNAKPYAKPDPLDPPDLASYAKAPDFKRPIIVGAGPAGMFCALYLARAGLRPLVIERGKPAIERMADIESFASGGALNADSNVQFGEGGAGTFSDGKLNTGIKSPHIRHVLQEFVDAGAPEDILIEAKPHIGTDKLIEVVQNLRHEIEDAGGEFMFSTRLESIEVADGSSEIGDGTKRAFSNRSSSADGEPDNDAPARIVAITVRHLNSNPNRDLSFSQDGESNSGKPNASNPGFEESIQTIPANTIVLAIGHSARDTFQMFQDLGVPMERKPFAAGLRVEHLQEDLDRSQYGKFADHPALGAADYKLAAKTADGRGVYTFCMCPGGQIVAAASEEGGVCVNGMSEHARDGVNGNSAVLVEVAPDDLPGEDVLEGIRFQREMEQTAYELGMRESDIPYTSPVQTVEGFLDDVGGKPSTKVVPTYPRGVSWENLRECLPDFISESIAEGLQTFASRLDAFNDGQAVLTGVEARSSSPVRILRNRESLRSETVRGLYPCGEGAGYAGGIMSAAVDGIRVAEAICANM